MFNSLPLLTILIWLPILGGVALLFVRAGDQKIRRVALVLSALTFFLSVPLYMNFDVGNLDMQFTESHAWIPTFNINYELGIDGISLALILLTTFITALVILASWESIQTRVSQYMAAFLILEGLMIGVFSAMDAAFFYVMWEAMLIPMFLIIGIWGGERRIYATIKFFLYTFLGSVFMLVALLYLYFQAGSFSISEMHKLPIALQPQIYLFVAFLLAFAVKVPMWPVHTWLPDAHVEAPTGGSVILAAIMLKMGGYGFLRFSLPIVPDASHALDGLMIGLSLIAIVYIGFVALVQTDMKKLIAYSSISHMGFSTLGFFIVFQIFESTGQLHGAGTAMAGGVVQMISHGFISGALFVCIGVLYDRVHSRNIADYGGVANTMPKFAALFMLFALANAGLPGTSGFVGEFLVIVSSFRASFWVAFIAASTLIVGAAYTLWMYKRVVFGRVANDRVDGLSDTSVRENCILGTLALAVLLFGIWPAPLLEVVHPSVDSLLEHIMRSKLP